MTSPELLVDVAGLQRELNRFANERDWGQFHSPKNLAMALAGEVGELSSVFQWMTEAQSVNAAKSEASSHAVIDEIADVLMYLVRLASVLDVDLDAAVRQKLDRNQERYPIDKARGSSKKYDTL